jgi:signal peptidase II
MQPEESVAPAPLPPSPPAGPPPAPASPPTASSRNLPFARPFEIGIILLVVVLDQITKTLVRNALSLGESRTLIPGLADLTHVQNTGAAFGLLNSIDFPYKPVVMFVIASLALLAIAAYGTQLGFHDRLARVGLALILGGAFGNLIDRIIHGHVVDFVDVYWRDVHFWAFNVADAAISVGAVIVLLDMLLDMLGVGRRHASHTV